MEVKFVLILESPPIQMIGGGSLDERQKLVDIFKSYGNEPKRLDLPLSEILGRDPMVRFVLESEVEVNQNSTRLMLSGRLAL